VAAGRSVTVCSVIGGFTEPSNVEELQELFQMSKERGNDAWGLWVKVKGVLSPYDERGIYRVGDTEPDWQELTFGESTFLGCLRGEPTTEWQGNTTEKDIQPFTVGQWTVVHNGTIANDKALWDQLLVDGWAPQTKPTEVDTWIIPAMFTYYGFEQGLKQLQGSFALLATHSNQPDVIYYAANYKPLWVLGDADSRTLLFASQEKYLTGLAGDPLHDPSPQQVKPYTYGTVTREGIMQEWGTLYPVRHPHTRRRALIVCSGGLDSSVVAWHHAIAQGDDITLLHLKYQAKAEINEEAAIRMLATKINQRLGYPVDNGVGVVFLSTDFFQLHATSALTDPTREITKGVAGAEFAHEWVPARNTVMMALAMAYAEAHDFDVIAIGSNQEESCGGYPDNEQEFVNRLRDLAPMAVKPYHQLVLSDPLGGRMKHEIVQMGMSEGMPFEVTWSCYTHDYDGEHCGNCGPCIMRQRAFQMANVADPTRYAGVKN
jgi:7-cyano-7-deazaguanine synthase